MKDPGSPLFPMLLVLAFLCGIWADRRHARIHAARSSPPRPVTLDRMLDTLPTGTVVVCYAPHGGQPGLACILDPAMEGATP